MSVVQFSAARPGNGRFIAGVSGNPAGRPKGSKNRSTLLMASLGEADAEAVVAAAVAKAKAGDGAMLRCLVTRILPAVRSRPVELAVPEGSETDLHALHDATLRGLAQGEILPDEALMIARALEKMARALATAASAAAPSSRRSRRRTGERKQGAPANRLYPPEPASRSPLAARERTQEVGAPANPLYPYEPASRSPLPSGERRGPAAQRRGGEGAAPSDGLAPEAPVPPLRPLTFPSLRDGPLPLPAGERDEAGVPPADRLFFRPASHDGRDGASALVDGRLGASLP
jgi:hypothetical protein